jgi:hypothetical protein
MPDKMVNIFRFLVNETSSSVKNSNLTFQKKNLSLHKKYFLLNKMTISFNGNQN